ncbi:MAG: hypothetical protein IJM78_01495 [Prevotella sp.]|nr:hypothetical protein [Prevotella sp.]
MRKIYIAPETEQLHVIKEVPLCAGTFNGSGTSENIQTGGTTNEGLGDGTQNPDARQHNNWMWDTMEDEY